MDDIDRTFANLQRTPFKTLYGDGFGWFAIDPSTFNVIVLDCPRIREKLKSHGWAFEDFAKELNHNNF